MSVRRRAIASRVERDERRARQSAEQGAALKRLLDMLDAKVRQGVKAVTMEEIAEALLGRQLTPASEDGLQWRAEIIEDGGRRVASGVIPGIEQREWTGHGN
jgi:hypothetical protein